MVAAITAVRQVTTVQPGGRIELSSPDLPPGARAEVIVLIESPAARMPGAGQDALQALDALQQSVALDRPAAAQWTQVLRAEREVWPAPDPTR
jgi:hypothetical protein